MRYPEKVAPVPPVNVPPQPTFSNSAELLLRLLRWPKIGPVTVRALVRASSSDDALLENAQRRFPDAARAARASGEALDRWVEHLRSRCSELGIHVLSLLDQEYPAILKRIEDAPPLLYVKGSLSSVDSPSVAVVGTRKASEAGLAAARRIAAHIAARHFTVVSGLALGIDTAAHTGALEGQGRTVAVLAHGLDTVAPSSNRKLADRILEADGALVSEHAPGVPPRPPEFARRNRIQSGLSLFSIVVESGAEGGAMIQAQFTKDQHKPLFAVASASTEFNDEGMRRLVSEFGAHRLAGLADLDRVLVARTRLEQGATEPAGDQHELDW